MAIAAVVMPPRGKVQGEAMSTLANGLQRKGGSTAGA